jgi:hypothetical protein
MLPHIQMDTETRAKNSTPLSPSYIVGEASPALNGKATDLNGPQQPYHALIVGKIENQVRFSVHHRDDIINPICVTRGNGRYFCSHAATQSFFSNSPYSSQIRPQF